MAEPHWTGYVGVITGVAGAIMGYVSYRRSNEIRSLDLRIELKRALVEAHSACCSLQDKMVTANNSKMAVAAAIGMLGSGAMQNWNNAYASDQDALKQLANDLPAENSSFEGLSLKSLEAKLVKVHRTSVELDSISQKYSDALVRDDEERRHLREDKRAERNDRPRI